MTSLLLVAALATSLPTVDIKGICCSAQAAALPEDRSRAFDSCVNEEEAALKTQFLTKSHSPWYSGSGPPQAEAHDD